MAILFFEDWELFQRRVEKGYRIVVESYKYKVESRETIAENELTIEILGLIMDKWKLGRMDFEVSVEKWHLSLDFDYWKKV